MAYTAAVEVQALEDAKPSTPRVDTTLIGSKEGEESKDVFKPIKYLYHCYNYDGADFYETYDAPLQLKVAKELKQVPATGVPDCVFEISTRVEANEPSDSMEDEPKKLSLNCMKVKVVNKAKMTIHSLPLVEAIREVIKYYPSQNLVGDEVLVHEPYLSLIHHIRELRELRDRLKADIATGTNIQVEEKCSHIDVLLDFLNPRVQRMTSAADKRLLKETPTVVFEDVWYLLKPGTLSYFLHDDIWLGGVIEAVSFDEATDDKGAFWTVTVIFQDTGTSGQTIDCSTQILTIETYDGEKIVTTLPVFPRTFHDKQDNLERRLAFQKRGALARDIIWGGYKYMKYSGKLMGKAKRKYDGPVIIGPSELHGEFPENNWMFDVTDNVKNTKVEDGQMPTLPLDLVATEHPASVVSDDHLFMMCPVMTAFALLTKTWELVNIDSADPLDATGAIPDANIKAENLEIIKALSERQIRSQNPWSADFIKDKGEGVVVLLHGPPGVGKTYTVESVAANTRRPLISLTIADLGTKEESIESQLTRWFALADKWRAIMLLDEADVFLERREHKDISRNGIVSAFLRKMEFFKGLLFLTTNRVGHIDEAFISRVHVIVGFEKLNPEKRKKIWKNFLDKLHREQKGKIRVTPACNQFLMGDEMGEMDWNGREIRNALQTAIALAEYDMRGSEYYTEGDEITVESDHFKKVMRMSSTFREYLNSIRKDDEAIRGKMYYGRNDFFVDDDGSVKTVASLGGKAGKLPTNMH